MIKKLQMKFVVILMSVVTIILLAIFSATLLTAYQLNNRFNVLLRQAPIARPHEYDNSGPDHKEATKIIIPPRGSSLPIFRATNEQDLLKRHIINSLIIGVIAWTIFLLISIFLSRLAIRPVKIAWQNQKQFVSDASHELKTPLTVILSNIDMLQKDASDSDSKTSVRMDHIQVEATRMKQLVENMLTLARSDSSSMQTNSLVNFSYIVRDVTLVYEPILFDEHKTLTFDITDDVLISGDAGRLQQLVHILLDNAHKYSSPSGIIDIRLTKLDTHNLQLMVSNTGDPIPHSELDNIFLRFYRRDESRSEHDSFGLGLSIAQSIVSEHSGEIWAESNETGNQFYVTLSLN